MNGLLLDARGAASPPQIDCGETWFHAMDAPCTLFHVQPRQELRRYKQELSQSARFGSAPEWAVVGLNIVVAGYYTCQSVSPRIIWYSSTRRLHRWVYKYERARQCLSALCAGL